MQRGRPQCHLRTVSSAGADGAWRVTQVAHVARQFAPHFFTTHAVGVVESGRCRVMTPRGSWIAGPGSILAFSPRELHWAQVLSDEPYAYRTAYLSAECMRTLGLPEQGVESGSQRELVPISDPCALSPAFVTAHHAVLDDPGNLSAVAGLLGRTRELLRAAAGPPPRRIPARDLALVDKAKTFLTAHIGRPVSLTNVAESCEVTTFHLIRVFRRVTGLSPYAYLIVLRVNEARRLLDAGASVSAAVHAGCFSDQSHLTRVFRRTLGMPPGLYLRSAR